VVVVLGVLECLPRCGDLGRVVLQVAVERDDPLALCRVKAGA
jgi:hypothetical protein